MGWPWISAAFLLLLFAIAWPFSVDDAFILARYARRLAHGQGYTFNDGPPTDGVTGPLWLLPLWLGASLGLHPLWVGKVFGALATALGVGRLVSRVRRANLGRLLAPLTSLLCLSSVPLIIWPVAGLETGLATLVAIELALSVTQASAPGMLRAGGCAALCAWLRPELALFVLAMLVVLSVRAGRASPERHTNGAWRAWLVCSLGALSVLLFRFLMFGHWLPMSSAAKPSDLRHGLDYLASALGRPETLLALLVLLLARSTRGRSTWLQRSLLFALSAHALAVLLAGGDWMPGFRLLCPVVPLFAWVLALAFADLWRTRRVLFWALLVPLLSLRCLVLVQELSVARVAGLTREGAWPRLREVLRDKPGVIAAVDVGLLGEAHGGPILDLGGLTDPRIAYAPGGHLDKRLSSGWLAEQRVELFMLHSSEPIQVDSAGHVRWFRGFPVERRVLSLPWVIMNYRVLEVFSYHDEYHYVLLTPRSATP